MSKTAQKITQRGSYSNILSNGTARIDPGLVDYQGNRLPVHFVSLSDGFLLIGKNKELGTFDVQNITTTNRTLEYTAAFLFSIQEDSESPNQVTLGDLGVIPSPVPPVSLLGGGGGGLTSQYLLSPETYTCDGSVSIGEFVAMDGAGNVQLCDPSDPLKMPVVGMIIEKPTPTTCKVAVSGSVSSPLGSSAGSTYFASSVPGSISPLSPPAPDIAQVVGFGMGNGILNISLGIKLQQVS